MSETKEKTAFRKVLAVIISIIFILAAAAAVIYFGFYRDVRMFLTAELGEGAPPAGEFMRSGEAGRYLEEPDVSLTAEGRYFLTVGNDRMTRKVLLIVRDTKAPSAESAEKVLTVDDKELSPEDALTEIYDASEYTVEWVKQPEYGKAGSYECSILLRDALGNEVIIKPTVKIIGAVESITVEAGSSRPVLADFMVVERENAEMLTDLDDITWTVPGEYSVEIAYDGKSFTSVVKIVDTTAPVPDLVPAAVMKGASVRADDFVIGCEDATEVKYELLSTPDTSSVGTKEYKLKATDAAGNTAEGTVELIVCDALAELEAADGSLTQELLMSRLNSLYTGFTMQSEAFPLTSLGAHEVTVKNTAGESAVIGVVVKDTTAPTAKGITCPCSTGYYCEPIKFVEDIKDMSTVSADFVTEPDWSVEGEQDVEIILKDRSGNETKISAKASVSPDKTPPVIYAARDRYLYVDEAVAYFKEVFAEDNADPDVKLTVDKSKVDAKKAGTYDVTYTATDHEGNESSVTVKYTFIEQTVSDEKLETEVNRVIDTILKDGMTLEEQAYAIHDYVYSNLTYWDGSDKTNWKAEAYRGFTTGVGDCFTFYSMTYALLQKIDCQVLSVERLNGRTQHFWCLVNLGTGWYHFDTCNVGPEHIRCFMKTSEELVKYSVQYWRFDTTLYPALETKPYVRQS